MLIFRSIPQLLFLLIGGVVVDRFPRLQLMLISDLVRALSIGLLTLLAFTNLLAVWHMYLICIIFGFVSAFFQPAYRAALADLLPSELLNSGNFLTTLSRELTGVVGPGIGAVIVGWGGSNFAFGLNTLSFVVSGLCLLPISNLSKLTKARPGLLNMLGDLREGLRMVFSTPWLWITIVIASISNITYSGPMGITLPFLFKEQLHLDVSILGLF